MQVKVYVPKLIGISQRVSPRLGQAGRRKLGRPGRRGLGHPRPPRLSQAVQDGLLRDFDHLIGEDGTVDLICDPGMEIPLELENKALSLTELLEALQFKRPWSDADAASKAA